MVTTDYEYPDTTCTNADCTFYFTPPDIHTWPEVAGQTIKELLRLENAAKATAMMVVLGKRFKAKIQALVYMVPVIVRRSLFCKSGYLPKKIKRIRKK